MKTERRGFIRGAIGLMVAPFAALLPLPKPVVQTHGVPRMQKVFQQLALIKRMEEESQAHFWRGCQPGLMPPHDYLVNILGVPEAEAQEILAAKEKYNGF